jgi:hypothetical protein
MEAFLLLEGEFYESLVHKFLTSGLRTLQNFTMGLRVSLRE